MVVSQSQNNRAYNPEINRAYWHKSLLSFIQLHKHLLNSKRDLHPKKIRASAFQLNHKRKMIPPKPLQIKHKH